MQLSLKGLIRLCRLPLVATFKVLHATIFTLIHLMVWEGLRFQFKIYPEVMEDIYGSYSYYLVAISVSASFIV
jgi:hypothetical protein